MSTANAPLPFRFDCHQCGHCCRIGHGQVWITETDAAEMASALGMEFDAFVHTHVRAVEGNWSLREQADGSCVLLDGNQRCRTYEQRPEQCSSFPFWPSVLSSAASLVATAAYCPGIQILPDPVSASVVLRRAQGRLQAKANAAEVPSAASTRWVSAIEIDLYLAGGGAFQAASEEATLQLEQSLLSLCEETGYPWSRAQWPRLLRDRRRAWQEHDRQPTLYSEP